MDDLEFGTGAIPDHKDERDYVIDNVFGAPLVNWDVEFRLPEPPTFDQKGSDCCVACAWSYFHWQLKGKTFSKRDLFCRIALDYGAEIRAGGLALVKEGQADNKEVKDPSVPTAANMRDKSGTKQGYRDDDIAASLYLLKDQSMDGLAWAIQYYRGIVFGVRLSREGWKDKLNPRPPLAGEPTVGHAIYGFGYHRHDGMRCIIAKSSWSASNEHHIKENYFTALDATFNAWVVIPKGTIMNDHVKIINYKGTIFIGVGAEDIPQAVALGKAFGRKVEVNSNNEITNADITVP